jgi:4-amino-4-deoxy-L-arabinose transferase-like glycosyltransferase
MREALRPTRSAIWTAFGAIALLLITAPRYGFHRDELYFVVAGRNLDWGYVDQPPLVPLIARLSESVAGLSPFALRVLPALAVGAIALMASLIAKRLGGTARAQAFAAVATGFAGVVLGEGHLLSTAIFDFALWTGVLLALVHLLGGASPRIWVLVGILVGVGIQNKHTMVFLAAALLIGILVTDQRRLLRSPWPWFGVVIAFAIALPNLVWQARNNFPQLEMAEALRERSEGPLAFVLFQPLLLSVVLAIPAAIGLWRLARAVELKPWRPLAVSYLLLFLAFLFTGAKPYYIAPMYSLLLAAGSLWFESLQGTKRIVMIGATAVGIAVGMLIALPLVPETALSTFDVTGELGETVGWPELIQQVSAVYESIPDDLKSDALILTSSYGEAGAVDVLGRPTGLPGASSGHNNYYLWGPPNLHSAIIGVGAVGATMELVCPGYREVGTITNASDVANEENGLPLYLCLFPESQLSDEWQLVKHYN